MKKYQKISEIGYGTSGTAYKCKEIATNKFVVIKEIKLIGLSEKQLMNTANEVTIISKLRHQHIIKYYEHFIENKILSLVMEYCSNGDISSVINEYIKSKKFIPEKLILKWLCQMTSALLYLHSNKILHRDLKTKNIYITSNNDIKIGDFGISKILEGLIYSETIIGTPYFLSPEVFENKPYSFESDIWSLGCILFELCNKKHTFDSKNLLSLAYKIVKQKTPINSEYYSQDLSNLIYEMLSKNPKNRPTINIIINENFLKSTLNKLKIQYNDVHNIVSYESLLNSLYIESGTYDCTRQTFIIPNSLQITNNNINNISNDSNLSISESIFQRFSDLTPSVKYVKSFGTLTPRNQNRMTRKFSLPNNYQKIDKNVKDNNIIRTNSLSNIKLETNKHLKNHEKKIRIYKNVIDNLNKNRLFDEKDISNSTIEKIVDFFIQKFFEKKFVTPREYIERIFSKKNLLFALEVEQIVFFQLSSVNNILYIY